MNTKHQCNQLTKKNSRSCRSVEILFRCTERRNILEKNSGARNSRAVRSQNDNCYSLFGPPKKQGQNLFDLKQDRGVAKRTECVGRTKQFNNCEEIQQHKRMALLRGSFTLEEETRYKLDEEAPLTTPASVLGHCRLCFERAPVLFSCCSAAHP